jgi:hypothetical protein
MRRRRETPLIGVAVFVAACAHDSPPRAAPSPEPAVVRISDAKPLTSAPAERPPPVAPSDRDVLDVCERYRLALEARDADALMALVSPRYSDDGGTSDPADDIDYAELKAGIASLLASVDSVKYELRHRRIRREPPRIIVEISYSATFVMNGKPHSRVDDSELVLEHDDGTYRFLSGL